MQLLLLFFRLKNTFLTYLVTVVVSLVLIGFHNRYSSIVTNEAISSFRGYLNQKSNDVTSYFGLKDQNSLLAEENVQLRNKIEDYKKVLSQTQNHSVSMDSIQNIEYNYVRANIISNSINQVNNTVVLDRGFKQGVQNEMGIVSSKGIIGMTVKSSENYTQGISILNPKFRTSARIKSTGAFGSLQWDGQDSRFTYLLDIPKYEKVTIGDTIETDGRSTVFPKGILIGSIEKVILNYSNNDLKIKVRLFENIGKAQNVSIVENINKKEIDSISTI